MFEVFDPHLLESFLILVEERNFSRAAKRLHISQPALSKRMTKLQQMLGHRLIDSRSRRLQLTVSGERFHELIVGMSGQLTHELTRLLERHEISLAVEHGVITHLLAEPLSRFGFVADRPLQLRTSVPADSIRMILAGEVDMAIVERQDFPSDIQVTDLALVAHKIILHRSHRLAHRGALTAQDLHEESFISFPKEHPDFRMVDDFFRQQGFTWKATYETVLWQMMIELARQHQVVAIVPAYCQVHSPLVESHLIDFPCRDYVLIEHRSIARDRALVALKSVVCEAFRGVNRADHHF